MSWLATAFSLGTGGLTKLYSFLIGALLVVVTLGGVYAWAYQSGKSAERSKWELAEKIKIGKAEAATAVAKQTQAILVSGLQTKLREALGKPTQIRVITEEVERYVTPIADADCTVTAGFEWMYNLPLDPTLADRPPGDVDRATSLKASEVAAIAASNNAECVARGEVVSAWQEWYAKSKTIYEKAIQDAK